MRPHVGASGMNWIRPVDRAFYMFRDEILHHGMSSVAILVFLLLNFPQEICLDGTGTMDPDHLFEITSPSAKGNQGSESSLACVPRVSMAKDFAAEFR
jgi:hypothetical protein